MAWQRSSSSGHDAQTADRVRSRGESDVEKEAYGLPRRSEDDDVYDDDPLSATSSRSASVHKPMLNRAFTNSGRSSYLIRFPNSIMRWLCLGVAATILIFMFSLVRMSHSSAKEVEVAVEEKIHPKPKKPTWESFRFLDRYYGGVRKLVSVEINKPEYPKFEDEAPTNVTDPEEEDRTWTIPQKREQFHPA